MAFFDFHVHIALKPQFNDINLRNSPWDNFQIGNPLLNSQSSADELARGGINLFGLVLHAPEQNMASELNRFLTEDSLKMKVLKFFTQKVFSAIMQKVSIERLKNISSGQIYYQLIQDELNNINTHFQNPSNQFRVKILTNSSDYYEHDTSTLHGFLIIEGMHCFFGDNPITSPDGKKQFFNNFDEFTKKNKVIAANITHLQQNNLCNHSFGIKIFDDSMFYPDGDGFVDGFTQKVIDALYSKNILIDIKHLSAKSRQQLYDYRNTIEADLPPLVCTHAGVTGIKRSEAAKYIRSNNLEYDTNRKMFTIEYFKKLGHLQRTSFNLSSLNLYDEDIEAIIISGGLIGVSFDRRIIGYTESYDIYDIYDVEYLSEGEKQFLFQNQTDFSKGNQDYLESDTLTIQDLQNTVILDLRFFFNQIFHILLVGISINRFDLATKSICIGSDFDGMIDSIDCCNKASDMLSFYNLSKDNFLNLADEAGIDISICPNLIDDIFFSNGKNFVLNRLN